ISYATARIFESDSVYTIQLSKKVPIITHHKDKAVLHRMDIKSLIEKNFSTIHPDAKLGDLVKVIADSTRNIFPVVDENGKFHGIIVMDQVRHIMFEPDKYDKVSVRSLMFTPTNV
ncbi:MAG: chloride channel protein, partial [Phototrophicales bacterium]